MEIWQFNETISTQDLQANKYFVQDPSLFSNFRKQKPFLKWAGGKKQLILSLLKYKPNKFHKYIEPFIGGGALYFSLNHPKSIISDSNEDLIIAYKEVKDNVHEIINLLEKYENTESFFYKIRALNTSKLSKTARAARLIYLNKTCFNGLFRVNKKGEFNVPYGKNNSPFLNKENLIGASAYLQNTEIYCADYKEILTTYAEKNDFIFLDPPYQPIGKHSDFKRYTKEFFYENDQIELSNIFNQLVKRGCKVLLTNSNHPLVLELYKDYPIQTIETKRLISSNPKTRFGIDVIVSGGF